MTAAAAAETRMSHTVTRVRVAPALAPRSLSRQVRDTNAANAYQTLAQNVWQAIIERMEEDNQRQICQATQLVRINDGLAFLAEPNTTRSQHLATFQGNVELWAADHQQKVRQMEEDLQQARDEIRQLATGIPLPGSPAPGPSPPQLPHPWCSPT